MNNLLEGLGGTVRGSFFRAHESVDLEKKPGATSLRDAWEPLIRYFNLGYFFYSPNLIWWLIAAFLWVVFPYHLEPKDLSVVFRDRLLINLGLVYGYFGFWHCALYRWTWCSRPFLKRPDFNSTKVLLHNVFYTTLGTMQWSLTEVAFVYCYMTGRLSYHPVFSSTAGTLHLIVWCLAIPVIRDVHFYFCHRVLHTRFLYKYFHTVHHRNTDTEPFSGLCMHPTEHLYYFGCYGPFLWAGGGHPFLVFWMGVHVLISPVGGHSGYEDHWASDVFHYMHHRYFECNYGSLGIPLDYWFGTFKVKLEPVVHLNNVKDVNAKANLNGSPQNIQFLVLGVVVPAMALWWCLQRNDMPPQLTSFSIAGTPILAALTLHWPSKSISLWNHYLHPFHEDSAFSCSLHLALGLGICCIVPVASLIKLLLVEPESAQ